MMGVARPKGCGSWALDLPLKVCKWRFDVLLICLFIEPPSWLLFSPFHKTCLVTQESVVLSTCHVLYNMTFWPSNVVLSRVSQKNGVFQCQYRFIYARRYISMNKDFYQEIFPKGHTLWSYQKNGLIMRFSSYHTHYKSRNLLSFGDVYWCWNLAYSPCYP